MADIPVKPHWRRWNNDDNLRGKRGVTSMITKHSHKVFYFEVKIQVCYRHFKSMIKRLIHFFHHLLTYSSYKWYSFLSRIFLCMWGSVKITMWGASHINISTPVVARRGLHQDPGSPQSMHMVGLDTYFPFPWSYIWPCDLFDQWDMSEYTPFLPTVFPRK